MVLLSPLLDQVHKGLKVELEFVFSQCIKTGIIPVPPEIVQNEELDCEFVSALALAQKIKGISGLERFVTFTANIANSVDPTLIHKLKGDKIVDGYAEIANIDPCFIVSNEDLNKKREENAQAQAQQQQMQTLAQGAELIKNIGGVDSIGSDMARRMGMG